MKSTWVNQSPKGRGIGVLSWLAFDPRPYHPVSLSVPGAEAQLVDILVLQSYFIIGVVETFNRSERSRSIYNISLFKLPLLDIPNA
jgi:hypothetical protein